MLPTIHSSSEIFGSVSDGSVLDGLSIAGVSVLIILNWVEIIN